MQHNETFEGTVEGIDAVFSFKKLKFRDTEKVLSLIEDFRSGNNAKKQVGCIREAFDICVARWSRVEPLSDWDVVIDLQEAVKVLNVALKGHHPSEADAKK